MAAWQVHHCLPPDAPLRDRITTFCEQGITLKDNCSNSFPASAAMTQIHILTLKQKGQSVSNMVHHVTIETNCKFKETESPSRNQWWNGQTQRDFHKKKMCQLGHPTRATPSAFS